MYSVFSLFKASVSLMTGGIIPYVKKERQGLYAVGRTVIVYYSSLFLYSMGVSPASLLK